MCEILERGCLKWIKYFEKLSWIRTWVSRNAGEYKRKGGCKEENGGKMKENLTSLNWEKPVLWFILKDVEEKRTPLGKHWFCLLLLLLLLGPCYFSFVNCTQQYPHYVRWCTLLFLRRSFLKRYQEEVYLVEWERITEKEKGTSSKINAADLYSTTQHGALCTLSYSIMFNLISTDLCLSNLDA